MVTRQILVLKFQVRALVEQQKNPLQALARKGFFLYV